VSPVHQFISQEGNATGWNRATQGHGAACSTLELLEFRCNSIPSGCCYALGRSIFWKVGATGLVRAAGTPSGLPNQPP